MWFCAGHGLKEAENIFLTQGWKSKPPSPGAKYSNRIPTYTTNHETGTQNELKWEKCSRLTVFTSCPSMNSESSVSQLIISL